jgi:hypothetical protein
MINQSLLSLGIASLATFGAAQSDGPNLSLVPSLSAGTYYLNNANTRAVFGKSPFAFGIGLGTANRAGRAGLGGDITGLSLDVNGNRFQMLGYTFGIESQTGDPNDAVRFYGRAGAGLGYYNWRFIDARLGTANSGSRFMPLSTVEAGVLFGKNFSISAQYNILSKVRGNDFSGLRLQASISFGK